MTTPPPPPPGDVPPSGPPPGGPPPGGPPPGFANSDEKTWALVAHFGGAGGMLVFFGVGGWIGPLIAMLAKGNESPTIRQHAVNALNFQLTWSVVGLIGWVTACILIGWLALLAAAALGIIFGIVAGVKANEGQFYNYPAAVKVIK